MNTHKPVLLDLFCGAGGASMGYHLAGFDVIGVDLEPQPNYPFQFIQGDVFKEGRVLLHQVAAVHASPPCHDHSTVTGRSRKESGTKGTGWMLQATRDMLDGFAGPWVIENVEGARMPEAPCEFRLCGSSFGLDVRRHRKFVSNVEMVAPPCDHGWQTPRFVSLNAANRKAGKLASVVGVHGNCNYAGEFPIRCAAMDIHWMTNAELCQAIPPAYTRWIGERLRGS